MRAPLDGGLQWPQSSHGLRNHLDRSGIFAMMATILGSTQNTANAELLTVDEVAARLRMSKWSVYRRVEAGELPAVRLGFGPRAPIRVSERELEAWLFSEEQA